MFYEAQFHFGTDMVIPEKMEELYIEAYNIMRGVAVEAINPCFEKWNQEYKKEVHGENDHEYNAYIAGKQQAILDVVNSKLDSSPVRLIANRENGDIEGEFELDGKKVTMFFTLKPLVR